MGRRIIQKMGRGSGCAHILVYIISPLCCVSGGVVQVVIALVVVIALGAQVGFIGVALIFVRKRPLSLFVLSIIKRACTLRKLRYRPLQHWIVIIRGDG